MIKYLGSKRTLIPALTQIFQALQPQTGLDLFTGTTRVACAMKELGIYATANDVATYSQVLADCYIATDARDIDRALLQEAIDDLMATPPEEGYFTEHFCRRARFFQPKNGARVDAIRQRLADEFAGSALFPILLTSLMEAADRVDSTTGQQMAFLKQWAPRSYNDVDMRLPNLLDGPGSSSCMDANQYVRQMDSVDLAYLDPPYNQHRYFTNYHIWETLVRWDKPETYGIVEKRIDARDAATKSAYNRKRDMPIALFDAIDHVRARTLVLSYNDESWIAIDDMMEHLRNKYEAVAVFGFNYKRYVGAQIGIYNLDGDKVGKVGHLRNVEHIYVAGDRSTVGRVRKDLAGSEVSRS